MKWYIIALLSSSGIIMGAASLAGWTEHIEVYEWIVIALVCAYVLSKQTTSRLFLHGLVTGILCGIAFAVVQASFFDLYLRNNPASALLFEATFGETDQRLIVLLLSPVVGLVYGVVIGILSAAASRFHIPK